SEIDVAVKALGVLLKFCHDRVEPSPRIDRIVIQGSVAIAVLEIIDLDILHGKPFFCEGLGQEKVWVGAMGCGNRATFKVSNGFHIRIWRDDQTGPFDVDEYTNGLDFGA